MTITKHPPWLELKVIREKDGYTSAQFADALQISRGHLHDLENGRSIPRPDLVKRMALLLNVPVSVIEPRRAA